MFDGRVKVIWALMVALLAVCQAAGHVQAQENEPAPLTVAVFNFETKGEGVADLGEKIADLLTVFLSTEDGLQLVERAQIKKILEEMELGASGLVDSEKAARIGGMLGAQVLVTGRAFLVNEKLYLTGKAISVDTSRVNAQLAKGDLNEDLDAIVQKLATQMAEWLLENADKMVAPTVTPADQVNALRKALGKEELPTMVVTVAERHVGREAVDPAAEIEVMSLLRKVGVTLFESKQLDLSDWASEYVEDAQIPLPQKAHKADVVIVGEGIAEFAGRQGNLISVKARVELKAIHTRTNRVLAVSQQTVTRVDLAELIAGKTALGMAAGRATVELIPAAVEQWRRLPKNEKEKSAGE